MWGAQLVIFAHARMPVAGQASATVRTSCAATSASARSASSGQAVTMKRRMSQGLMAALAGRGNWTPSLAGNPCTGW